MKQLRISVLGIAALLLPAASSRGAEELLTKLDALVAQRQYARAEQLVDQRITNGDDPGAAYFHLGKVYFNHELWQRSAGFLERSLKLRGVNDQAHQLLGLDWRELHRPDDAEAELIEAARENPANPGNAYFAGHQLILNGKLEAALPYLYQALAAQPLQPQALQALALVQARLGNYGLAESYYRKALDGPTASRADLYPALVNLSVLLLLGHDPARLEEGLSFARQAVELRPDSSGAHFLAGKALFKLGRFQEAGSELSRAAKLNPDDSKPHFLLARIYDQLGQPDRAQKERKTLARIQGRPGQAGMAAADSLPVTSN